MTNVGDRGQRGTEKDTGTTIPLRRVHVSNYSMIL